MLTTFKRSLSTELCCSVVVSLVCLSMLVVYMEVVPKPNTMSDDIKVFLDDLQWPELIKDSQLKQIKHNIVMNLNNVMRGKLLQIYNKT